MVGLGAQQVVAEAELLTQLDGPGLLRDERVRPALDDESVPVEGVNLAAEAVGALEQDAGDRGVVPDFLLDAVSRRQAGDAPADDNDLFHAAIMTGSRDRRKLPA